MSVLILNICTWLEETPVGILVRESLWGFQVIVAFHLLGLMFSVGTLAWFDLRLFGVSMQGSRVSDVYRRLAPWMLSGFALMIVTGAMLFAGFATRAYENTFFRIKVAAILIAGVNALVFHFVTERQIARWDDAASPPRGAKLAGGISMLAWVVVILAGRIMSYTMF